MKTLAFYAVFGVVPGYDHDNVITVWNKDGLKDIQIVKKTPLQIVSEAWQKAMQAEFDESEVLVTAVLHDSKTVYPVGFGCPAGGETTVTANGHLNPKFIKMHSDMSMYERKQLAIKEYYQAVIRVCEVVKKELKQTTVSVAFYEIAYFAYLKDD